MKNKKPIWIFTSNTQMIVSIILFVIFIAGFIYIGTIDFKEKKITDKGSCIKYYEYNEVTAKDALNAYKEKNVIMLFGVSNNAYVDYYSDMVGLIAGELGIKNIYYYDVTLDRQNHNGAYESLVEELKDYLTKLDNGVINIYGPTLVVKKDGIITYFDDSAAFVKGGQSLTSYFNEYETNLLKANIRSAFEDYIAKEEVIKDGK